MTHLRCIQNIFPLSLKKTVLCSHAYCRKLWIKLGIPMFFIIRMQRWEFIKYHSQKNTENIFTLVIMMPNGKERKITFKNIFIWKKKIIWWWVEEKCTISLWILCQNSWCGIFKWYSSFFWQIDLYSHQSS